MLYHLQFTTTALDKTQRQVDMVALATSDFSAAQIIEAAYLADNPGQVITEIVVIAALAFPEPVEQAITPAMLLCAIDAYRNFILAVGLTDSKVLRGAFYSIVGSTLQAVADASGIPRQIYAYL